MVGDFIICLLAFFNIFIIIIFLFPKKRGPERGSEGRVHVLISDIDLVLY